MKATQIRKRILVGAMAVLTVVTMASCTDDKKTDQETEETKKGGLETALGAGTGDVIDWDDFVSME